MSIRWGRYSTVAAAFLAGLVFAGGLTWGLVSNKLSDYRGADCCRTKSTDCYSRMAVGMAECIFKIGFIITLSGVRTARLTCRVKLILRWLMVSMLRL